MKRTINLISISIILIVAGCVMSPRQAVFNSLYTVEHTTVAAYDGYVDEVIAGSVPTNGVPRVSKAFNRFQASFTVALDAAQFNTNAIAPQNLVTESTDIINLINTVSK